MTKILLVEDDDSIRLGLRYYLEQESYQVFESSTVLEASKAVENDAEIDLILLDLNLPDGNGFDLFRTIKEKHDIPDENI